MFFESQLVLFFGSYLIPLERPKMKLLKPSKVGFFFGISFCLVLEWLQLHRRRAKEIMIFL